jgi:hypothetical protein
MQGEWDDPSMYEVDYTGGSGQVSMSVTATDECDTAALTVWGRDHAALTIELPVTATGVSSPDTPVRIPYITGPRPNPAMGSVTFQWASPNGDATLSIIDAAGRVIRRIELEPGQGGTMVWDCNDANGSAVPSGLYFALYQAEGADPVTRSMIVMSND